MIATNEDPWHNSLGQTFDSQPKILEKQDLNENKNPTVVSLTKTQIKTTSEYECKELLVSIQI